jgi:hypothetical protein
MEKWLRIGQPQVQEILDRDPDFQKLLSELECLEVTYQQVLKKLSPEDQEIVERYIGLCEELEYQKTHTAYKCGRMHRSHDYTI